MGFSLTSSVANGIIGFRGNLQCSCIQVYDSNWPFVKTSVKQSMKCKVCSNFQMSLLHFKSNESPIVEAFGQGDIFVRYLGQANIWSDVPPGRGI